MNHSVTEVRNSYLDIENEIDRVPFYWSAGLIAHPMFIQDTKRYIDLKKLSKNKHLWPFKKVPWLESLVKSYTHLSEGQSYAGITLNIFKKRGGLLMTSFENYGNGSCNFQQLPWCVNIDGIGIWSQSGDGSESISGFGIINTHSPHIKQRGPLLVAAYVTPAWLRTTIGVGSAFSSKTRLFWPAPFFQEQHLPEPIKEEKSWLNFLSNPKDIWVKGQWWGGKRGDCYVGVLCTQKTYLHTAESEDSKIKADGKTLVIPRRVCNVLNHAYIVVVGTSEEFNSLSDFISNRCMNGIEYKELSDGLNYEIKVTDIYNINNSINNNSNKIIINIMEK